MSSRTFRLFLLMFLASGIPSACGDSSSPNAPTPPAAKGSLQLSITGLPEGTDAEVHLSGDEYDQTFTASELVEELEPGSYSLSAGNVEGATESYTPSPSQLGIDVVSAQTARAQVNYNSTSGTDLDLRIQAAYLVQTTQRLDGGVPLIADRAALLRVFATANSSALVRPEVHVQLLDANDEEIASYTISRLAPAMPTAAEESDLSQSWNVNLPANQIRAGMKILARVDPTGLYAETDETNNAFPSDGEPLALDVRELGDLTVRFVPVEQTTTGLRGDVSASNKSEFTELAYSLFPTANFVAEVGATYFTDTAPLQPDDANGAWVSLLGEIYTMQQLDPVRTRHHYGVVDVEFGSGIAGIAYVGGRAGLGRDLRHPSLAIVFPHELGHNLSLPHAPCGVTGGDPDYPYPGGQIGVYGLDLETNELKAPTLIDIMGYCSNIWISDYNYELALDYRQRRGKAPGREIGDEVVPCYLVWGHFDGDDAHLEPVLELYARAVLPTGGPHRLDLELADGSRRRLGFHAETVADLGEGEVSQFAFLLPVQDLGPAGLRRVSITTAAGVTRDRSESEDAQSKQSPRFSLLRGTGDRLQIEWDAQQWPMLCVRDAATGTVLSFARRGRSEIATHSRELTISASNGLNSLRRTIRLD